MKYSDFQDELKRGVSGSYLFYGPEAYLKRHAMRSVRKHIIPDEAAEFNRFIFDESSFSVDTVYDAMQTVSFTAEKKLIEISGPIFYRMPEDILENLCTALKSAEKYDTVIVIYTNEEEFDAGTEKQPSKLLKVLSQAVKPVYFAKETPAKLTRWLQRHFASEGINASPQTCTRLLDTCGRDMFALSYEAAKLSAYIKSKRPNMPELLESDILEICIRNYDFDAFAFSDAITSGNSQEAMAVLSEMKAEKERPEVILGSIAATACDLYAIKLLYDAGLTKNEISSKLKIHEYRVDISLKRIAYRDTAILKRFAEACYSADIKIKYSPTDSYEILDKLVAEITHI